MLNGPSPRPLKFSWRDQVLASPEPIRYSITGAVSSMKSTAVGAAVTLPAVEQLAVSIPPATDATANEGMVNRRNIIIGLLGLSVRRSAYRTMHPAAPLDADPSNTD